MQMYPRVFPPDRMDDPVRQAEWLVYQDLAQCRAPGFAYYEWQRKRSVARAIQLDYALWLQGIGRFGLQVKGGHYILREGIWYRWDIPRSAYLTVPKCPLKVTSDSTMSLRNEVAEAEGRSKYFIPVLIFPDMETDEAISNLAERTNVHLVWGTELLIPRLNHIAREVRVWHPPRAGDIRREVSVITDGQIKYRVQPDGNDGARPGGRAGGEGNAAGPATVSTGPQVLIRHAKRVEVRQASRCGNAYSKREVHKM